MTHNTLYPTRRAQLGTHPHPGAGPHATTAVPGAEMAFGRAIFRQTTLGAEGSVMEPERGRRV